MRFHDRRLPAPTKTAFIRVMLTVLGLLVYSNAPAVLRIELDEIVITATWDDIVHDVQVEAVFPEFRLGGQSFGVDELCLRGEHFETKRMIPIWADFDRGEETDRVIVGYEKAKIPRYDTIAYCVLEIRDDCKRWHYETVERPTTFEVDVVRNNTKGEQTLAYRRSFTIPDCL